MFKNYKNIIGYVLFFVLVVGGGWLLFRQGGSAKAGELDKFAQCLADKKVTMYGAAWCPHCQNEKKAFGSSVKYLPYVECPENTKVCTDLGITSYPTWIFPGDKKVTGELGLEKISQQSGCSLPATETK
jgi:hypothetical protein